MKETDLKIYDEYEFPVCQYDSDCVGKALQAVPKEMQAEECGTFYHFGKSASFNG